MKPPIDPIIEELHQMRREIAQRFDYDVQRISEDARRRQSLDGRPLWQPTPANQGDARAFRKWFEDKRVELPPE